MCIGRCFLCILERFSVRRLSLFIVSRWLVSACCFLRVVCVVYFCSVVFCNTPLWFVHRGRAPLCLRELVFTVSTSILPVIHYDVSMSRAGSGDVSQADKHIVITGKLHCNRTFKSRSRSSVKVQYHQSFVAHTSHLSRCLPVQNTWFIYSSSSLITAARR